jgi:hypothetical protein
MFLKKKSESPSPKYSIPKHILLKLLDFKEREKNRQKEEVIFFDI